jgi:hypothetical protein
MAPSNPNNAPLSIGVLCLETYFTKVPGHIRNPATFDFPVTYQVVKGATPERMVVQGDETLLKPFIDAARELEQQGVAAITGSCGFLVLFQKQLADSVSVPVYVSSLIQVPMVYRMLRSDQKVGLLVAKKKTLTAKHLAAIGAEAVPVCVAGLDEQPEFREVIIEQQRTDLDMNRLEQEVLFEIDRLAHDNPDMGALVIECTDLPPFAAAIQQRIRMPVFDIVTLTNMVYQSLTRTRYYAR